MTLLISKIRRVLISQMTLLISKIRRVLISQMTLLISKISRLQSLIFQMPLSISKISLVSQLGVAHLFDEFTRDLWLFCSLPCQAKEFVKMVRSVTIMYVYCSMFYVSLQLFDTIKIRVRKEILFTTNEQDLCKQ